MRVSGGRARREIADSEPVSRCGKRHVTCIVQPEPLYQIALQWDRAAGGAGPSCVAKKVLRHGLAFSHSRNRQEAQILISLPIQPLLAPRDFMRKEYPGWRANPGRTLCRLSASAIQTSRRHSQQRGLLTWPRATRNQELGPCRS